MSKTQIDMSEVVSGSDFAQALTVIRHTGGEWIDGEFTEIENTINITGVVSAAAAKDIDMFAGGGRVAEYKVLHTTHRIYVTQDAGTSDLVLWNGEKYKVMEVTDASDYGYYRAVMHRLNVTD